MTRRLLPLAALCCALASVAAAAPAAAGRTRALPSFTAYTPRPGQARSGGGEPTVGVDPRTGAVLVQAMLQTFRVSGFDAGRRGASTWTDVTPPSVRGLGTLDPILETDRLTGRTYVSHLQGACSLMAYSDDAGTNWTPVPLGCGIGALADHQTVGAGPFRRGATLQPTGTYPNAVYYCAHDMVTANCSVSLDGQTFLPAVPAYPPNVCWAPHGHLTVGPDGTAYLPPIACANGGAAVSVTEDNGATWRLSPVPHSTMPGPAGNPSVAVGARGTAYFSWGTKGRDGGVVPAVAVTHDRARSWVKVAVLGRDAGVVNARFVSAIAGDDDRAAVAYLGSRTPGDASGPDFDGVWSLYVSVTYDAGRTWRTVDAAGRPVHRGGICLAGVRCDPNARLLYDFIDLATDRAGRLVAVAAVSCGDPRCRSVRPDTTPLVARQRSGAPLRAQ